MAYVAPAYSANTRCRDGIWKTTLWPQATEMRAISTSRQTECGDPCNCKFLLTRLDRHLPLKSYILWFLLEVLLHQTWDVAAMHCFKHPGPNFTSKPMMFGSEMLF